jgi:hypothetical protein
VCWECDEPLEQAFRVLLCDAAGQSATLTLCPTCHERCYLPLVTEAANRSGDRPHTRQTFLLGRL